MSPLTITSRDAATGPVLAIAGDLDHATAPRLREVVDGLALAPGQRVVLDLAGLDFCDSSGITVLLAARNLAGEAGAVVALAAVPANTARIMKLVGLDQIFTLYPDAAAATAPDPAPSSAGAADDARTVRHPGRPAPAPTSHQRPPRPAARGADGASAAGQGPRPQ